MKLTVLVAVVVLLACLAIFLGGGRSKRRIERRVDAFHAKVAAAVERMPKPKSLAEVSSQDGINPYEEILVVQAYVDRFFAERMFALPSEIPYPGKWRVRDPRQQQDVGTIYIDLRSGSVTSQGLPSIELVELQKPKQAPAPTPGSVTRELRQEK